jgi:hypothetical protein
MGRHAQSLCSTRVATRAVPIKPIGFVLLANKHHPAATLLIIVGEVVKLMLFEQLFDMTRPKLMSFRWFAWCYGRWRAQSSTCGRCLCGTRCSFGFAPFELGRFGGESPSRGTSSTSQSSCHLPLPRDPLALSQFSWPWSASY